MVHVLDGIVDLALLVDDDTSGLALARHDPEVDVRDVGRVPGALLDEPVARWTVWLLRGIVDVDAPVMGPDGQERPFEAVLDLLDPSLGPLHGGHNITGAPAVLEDQSPVRADLQDLYCPSIEPQGQALPIRTVGQSPDPVLAIAA